VFHIVDSPSFLRLFKSYFLSPSDEGRTETALFLVLIYLPFIDSEVSFATTAKDEGVLN